MFNTRGRPAMVMSRSSPTAQALRFGSSTACTERTQLRGRLERHGAVWKARREPKRRCFGPGGVMLTPVAPRITPNASSPSRVQRRLLEPLAQGAELAFQHTVLCQTGLPYR